ncbi:hypothetical protein [Larkinella harenae]
MKTLQKFFYRSSPAVCFCCGQLDLIHLRLNSFVYVLYFRVAKMTRKRAILGRWSIPLFFESVRQHLIFGRVVKIKT